MTLRDIADMEDYLTDRCYCPGEIYNHTGIFFRVYKPDMECELLCEGERGAVHGKFVIVDDQIVYIEITDDKVDSCVRIDNTENNRKQVQGFLDGTVDKMFFDVFPETKKEFDDVMSMVDAIMVK